MTQIYERIYNSQSNWAYFLKKLKKFLLSSMPIVIFIFNRINEVAPIVF